MSTSSQKHRDFVREPMTGKHVSEVPGIGESIGQSMAKTGLCQAKDLYGRYLSNPECFKGLVERHGGNSKNQNDAYKAMKEWDHQNN